MTQATDPFDLRNIRCFIAFRVLFNARFYYPVFSILFLDYGLTLSQFAILNSVWAATIVLCEVPSGALADLFGRRILLIFATVLMIVELILLLILPQGVGPFLFPVFVVNRILSGMAEAAASGADEALAYDTLVQHGLEQQWPRVLERQIQAQSIGFVGAMLLGGLVYDPEWMQRLVQFFGMEVTLSQSDTLRLPLGLTLITGLMAVFATVRMSEIPRQPTERPSAMATGVRAAFRLTAQTGRWILQTPFVLLVILTGLLFDSTIRMLLTLASQYYRLIGISEAYLGVLGAALAFFGLVIPPLARGLVCQGPVRVLLWMGLMSGLGLIGMTRAWPFWGIAPALLVFSVMFFVGFFSSHYLNQATASDRRATVLSFKGLAFNLGYGLLGLVYSGILALHRRWRTEDAASLGEEALKNQIFADSLIWFPWGFGLGLLLLILMARLRSIPIPQPSTQRDDLSG